MNVEQANTYAQELWGECGKALEVAYSKAIRYTVGETELPAKLGGRIAYVYGRSWVSFEDAFIEAQQGYESDPGIEENDGYYTTDEG